MKKVRIPFLSLNHRGTAGIGVVRRTFEEIGSRIGKDYAYWNLSLLAADQTDYEKAEELALKSYELFREAGSEERVREIEELLDWPRLGGLSPRTRERPAPGCP